MNSKDAGKLADKAIASAQNGKPTPVADTTVLLRNADGSYAVMDNGEEAKARDAAAAKRMIVANLTA